MKPAYSRSLSSLFSLAIFGMVATSATAANLMTMTFNNSGADINEIAGWNGTTAPGGSLATGLTISSGMHIEGDFTAQNNPDVFHVDNWHTTNNMTTTLVGMTIGTLTGYTFSLGSGTETFSTRVHQHPTAALDIFNAVDLYINGNLISSQAYTPGGAPQTLTWLIGANVALNNLTSATFDLRFTGAVNPGPDNHGPEWSAADGAFVSFSGTMIPEPSQAFLACIGMGLALVRRRR